MTQCCMECTEQISIHADGSAVCGCASVDYKPGPHEWPDGWEDPDAVETEQARELLLAAAAEEVGMRRYVYENVDEIHVMRSAGGDTEKALEAIRVSMEAEEDNSETEPLEVRADSRRVIRYLVDND